MIIHGDCLEEMKTFPDNHFSAIITDPPYGLKFMGKSWDRGIPGISLWKEALRISKPGSHILSFGGTRTYHRLVCAIEDAGWEIRDCLMWIYGSGFPKSHNHFGLDGYGTALKPAYEPIIMAMKPCDGTFKQNADKWGQAGINIDGCRIYSKILPKQTSNPNIRHGRYNTKYIGRDRDEYKPSELGRWPANVIFNEETAQMLDKQSGILKSGGGVKNPKNGRASTFRSSVHRSGDYIKEDSGGASRFFYCAKASSSEREEGNKHPTVKPLKLMEYLITLVMPPKDGLLLDPFAGSGTTILAAHNLGMKAIGIEKNEEYCDIAKKRLENAYKKTG